MINICKRCNFFKSLHRMKLNHPNSYKGFIPASYELPDEKDEFKDEIESNTHSIWLLKTNVKTKKNLIGIELISDPKKFEIELNSDPKKGDKGIPGSLIQQFIPPYLIDNHKFDLRVFSIITSLDPLTIYIYEESLAYFCIEPYSMPTSDNFDSFIVQKIFCSSSTSSFETVRPAKPIIKLLSSKKSCLWEKIKKITALSIISLFEETKKSAIKFCEHNDEIFYSDDTNCSIPPLNRFFNLISVDILIDENKNPFIININGDPELGKLSEFDTNFKSNLIKSEFELISFLLNKTNKGNSSWSKILPSEDSDIKFIIDKMDPGSKFNTSIHFKSESTGNRSTKKSKNAYKPTLTKVDNTT